jgi:hypothetical protein
VNLPEISGYELARRAANRNIPTLLSSGHPDADAKRIKSFCGAKPPQKLGWTNAVAW